MFSIIVLIIQPDKMFSISLGQDGDGTLDSSPLRIYRNLSNLLLYIIHTLKGWHILSMSNNDPPNCFTTILDVKQHRGGRWLSFCRRSITYILWGTIAVQWPVTHAHLA